MRLHKPHRVQAVKINIAPLIDVVFLLIIFSMTITQFKRAEYEKIELPLAREGMDAPPGPVRLTISVTHDGRILAEGQAFSLEALDQLLSENARQHGPASLEVLLRGDRRVDWRAVRQVMSACGRHGIARVRLAVADAPASSSP